MKHSVNVYELSVCKVGHIAFHIILVCVECMAPTTHTQQDSPTFPLYTEVMGKEKPNTVEGDGSQPELPQKQLTEEDLKELNLPTDEEVPSVPQQNLTTEDIQHMALSIEVLMFAC